MVRRQKRLSQTDDPWRADPLPRAADQLPWRADQSQRPKSMDPMASA
jgi:hypothetical protein